MTYFCICMINVVQKTATAVAHCKRGTGLVKVNGRPLDLVEPEMLRAKVTFTFQMIEYFVIFMVE